MLFFKRKSSWLKLKNTIIIIIIIIVIIIIIIVVIIIIVIIIITIIIGRSTLVGQHPMKWLLPVSRSVCPSLRLSVPHKVFSRLNL